MVSIQSVESAAWKELRRGELPNLGS